MDIQKLRKDRNLSQQELSNLTGVPKGRINGWEQRNTKPKKDDYETLLNFFNTYAPLSNSNTNIIPFWDTEFTEANQRTVLY